MKFTKYNDIENVTNKELIHFKESDKYNPADKWFVTEKIHGSNFAVFMDTDGNLTPAKRSSFISMETSFFNFQKVFDKYDIKYLANAINTGHGNGYGVSIHGEICGGNYPGVDKIPNAKSVQKEVKYSNDTELIVFDVRVYTGEETYEFLPHDIVVKWCNGIGVPVVPIIFEGTFDECLKWSSEHNADPSEAWKIFNMPVPVEGNIREGHVLKPEKSLFKGMSRVIFKDKNTKFKENSGAKDPNDRPEPVVFSDTLNQLYSKSCEMICTPRFNSVTSKYGEYSIKNFEALMRLMTADIFDEFERDSELNELYVNVTEVDKKLLHDVLLKKVASFMGANKKELF